MVKIKKTCVLKALENPNLNGLALGLEYDNAGFFKPNERFFPCCHGTGNHELTSDADHSPIHNIFRCKIKHRINAVNEIAQLYHMAWPKANPPHQVSKEDNTKLLSDLSGSLKGYEPQAKISFGKKDMPSKIWPLALACAWRFGIETHIINLDIKASITLPARSKMHATIAIFIENVDRLWEPYRAQAFETIIQYAYNSNALLWISCTQGQQAEKTNKITVGDILSHRIASLKSKSPLDYIDPDAKSRLDVMANTPYTPQENYSID